jgi:hypothetical protein
VIDRVGALSICLGEEPAPGARVDTRVVEATNRLAPDALPVQVGQMLDVFVEAECGSLR